MGGTQIVDGAQQMDPAALVGADMTVVGAREITDQGAPIVRAQDFLDHRPGSAPVIVEIAQRRGAEGPEPAGLIGLDYRTAPDLGSQLRQHRLGPPDHRPQQADQGPQPQMQPMNRLHQPLDRPERQPANGVEAGNVGDGLGADPVVTDHRVAEIQCRGDRLVAAGTDPAANDMLDDLNRNPGEVEHLAAADHLAPLEGSVAAGTVRDPMLTELGGYIPVADKLLGPGFAGLGRFEGPGRPDERRHPRRAGRWLGRLAIPFLGARREGRHLGLQGQDQGDQGVAVELFQHVAIQFHSLRLRDSGRFAHPP